MAQAPMASFARRLLLQPLQSSPPRHDEIAPTGPHALRSHEIGRLINGILVAVAGAILFLSVSWPAVVTDRNQSFSLASSTTEWGPATDPPSILLGLVIANPFQAGAELTQLHVRMDLDHRPVGEAYLTETQRLPPGGQHTVQVRIELPADFAHRWWEDRASMEGVTYFGLRGDANIRLLGEDHRLPIRVDRWWANPLLEDLSESVPRCDAAAPDPCVATGSFQWLVDGGHVFLVATLEFENPHAVDLETRRLTAGLNLMNQTVGSASGPAPALLPPGGRVAFTLPILFDENQIRLWWAEHLAGCEVSPAAFRIELDYATHENVNVSDNATVVDTTEHRAAWTTAVDPLETRFACVR